MLGAALVALGACNIRDFDIDLRNGGNGFTTAEAAREATAQRPAPDARGVISYPGYQVAVAQRGDRVSDVAARVGLPAGELASFNALSPDMPLREGELLALPRRVAESSAIAGARPGQIDITELASGAIERAETGRPGEVAAQQPGREPVRHRVERGETAFSIARLYNVSTRALADWNGLGPDLAVREGQYLLIPVPEGAPPVRTAAAPPPTPVPGAGSPTPEPPSAARPLPEDSAPATAAAPETPPSPDLGAERTAASGTAQFLMPVEGRIIRSYEPGRSDGIHIAAAAGTQVRAAASGTVAAITRSTDGTTVLVIRHADGLLTVYANIDNVQVERGAQVSRGDTIATVRAGDSPFLQFEVRRGFDSIDPMPFLS